MSKPKVFIQEMFLYIDGQLKYTMNFSPLVPCLEDEAIVRLVTVNEQGKQRTIDLKEQK